MTLKHLIVSLPLAMTFMAVRVPELQSQITPVNFPYPMAQGTAISGPVTNIDPVNQMIQVKDAIGFIQTFRLDQKIQIFKNGSPVRLNDLSLGDVVTVTSK